jgi:methylated-DNA-[protein]-cysteine S-methyltransferase
MTHYTLIGTAIGWARLAWTGQALLGAYLPEQDPEAARAGLSRRFPDASEAAPPAWLEPVIEGVQALLRGEAADLTGAPLDLDRVPHFNRQVYSVAQAIPPGETLTYGQIAVKLGDKRLAQQVGQALGQNPWPIIVPCHRVTAAGGKLGGFSARGGVQTKIRLLQIEGAAAAAQSDLFL